MKLLNAGKVVGTIATSLGVMAISGAPAQAALVSTDACDNATLTQPFAHWGDSSYYKLVPGGSFEGPSTWTLSGHAHTVAGSEPYGVTGSAGSSSLELPAGSSAQSPFTCADAAYPTFRFFARNDSLLSTLVVQVVYKTPLGVEVVLPVGAVALSGNWEPTASMLTASVVPALLTNGTTQVALRFTELTGTTQIDDVYMDPRMHD